MRPPSRPLSQRPAWSSPPQGTVTAFTLAAALGLLTMPSAAQAQAILEDGTLGAESSVVTRDVLIQGILSDRIDGGARRGANLFHSFEQFNIDAGRGAYFANPAGVEAIFSRVTGGNPSNILGRLGVLGSADLYFLNPNGILFGPAASLDLQGSFLATTASAFQFGDLGRFSATAPEVPSALLTINPSALFFNQVAAGAIVNRSVTPVVPGNPFLVGLRVPNGQSLTLLGGDVQVEGGRLSAFGGRIDIGAVAAGGTVQLNPNGSLVIPDGLARGDVTFTNGAIVDVLLGDKGDINVTARNISVLGDSELQAGIASTFGAEGSQAGDLRLNATGTVRIAEDSLVRNRVNENAIGNAGNVEIVANQLELLDTAQISTSTLGQGNAGNVILTVGDRILLDGGDIFSRVGEETLALDDSVQLQGGNIQITTGSLVLINGAQLLANTEGQGNAGSILIRAREDVTFQGRSPTDTSLPSAAFVRVDEGARGRGGNIDIQSRNLFVLDGARLFAGTLGTGDSGDIIINATGQVRFAGTGPNGQTTVAFTNVEDTGIGSGGDIRITAASVELADGAQLVASTDGQGDAGNVTIRATGDVTFQGRSPNGVQPSAAFSRIGAGGRGAGGNIDIRSRNLFVLDGARLFSGTLGEGRSGDILINATGRVRFAGVGPTGQTSVAFANTEGSAVGDGGNIRITANVLEMADGAQLVASTSAQGNAGDVVIRVGDRILLDGGGTAIFSRINAETLALDDSIQLRGGTIDIETGSLSVLNGAQLLSNTNGQGDAGDVVIRASGDVLFQGLSADQQLTSAIFSRVNAGATGRGGSINIRARNLFVLDGARLFSGTLGKGDSGDIIINATGRVRFAGTSPSGQISVAFSNVEGNAVGNGGDINVTSNSLELADGAQLVASTSAQGNAGDVILRVGDRISLDGGGTAIFSSVGADTLALDDDVRLRGGAIDIETGSLFLTNGASLVANTAGRGNAGQVTILAGRVSLRGTDTGIFSNVQSGAVGRGGTVRIQTGSLSIRRGAQLIANTAGEGNAGNIRINATGNVRLAGFTNETGRSSGLFTNTRFGAQGRGGEIFIRANRLRILNGAVIYALSENNRRGGSIRLSVNEFEATGGGQVIASALRRGRAGSITLDGGDILFSGSDPTVGDRREKFGTAVANVGDGQSGLFADTQPNSRGRGGSITLRGNSLQVLDSATISAQTAGQGDAGDINIAIRGGTQLNNGNITAAGRFAAGGSITLNTSSLFLTERAAITAASRGRGTAGNIRINTGDRLEMSDGDITTRAPRSSGGNIEINTGSRSTRSFMVLEGDSDITTNSRGDGGNITIGGAGVVAFDDSDIISRAAEGRGGNITLPPFFSETNPPGSANDFDRNDQVDLNASGQTAPGQIITPDTSSVQNSLTPLADASIDEGRLLANSCVVRDRQSGRFVITGSGGLPYAPGDASLSPFPTGDVQPLPETTPEPLPQSRSWQPGDPIIEPQGVYELTDGRLVLSRECDSETTL
ncbi:filamentous hemagglutinin N-terminal domain-containing protein [Thermoleptolyngbya sp. M55_K2018_002]|uniref:two-partner secretion domain-containing protein n=1 Tax=Thermoleptolyngbya sp. M55_K2018_002 TaxID=2747808 RepID=UPI0019E13F2D|nr:filamentous hemagglutinin N-terminal domain-containing protein [Thermoleptolyngbya sp. M55_K2018_002]HIK41611.1 filamentous hemagglutinin N-terminal domain-containing protein [Thermoleptolyngbya sp. M55_K2018_002]